MQKVRFLQNHGTFKKDTYRVIMGESTLQYLIQTDLHSDGVTWFHKKHNSKIYQVVERS